jgi:hypothetical protein
MVCRDVHMESPRAPTDALITIKTQQPTSEGDLLGKNSFSQNPYSKAGHDDHLFWPGKRRDRQVEMM